MIARQKSAKQKLRTCRVCKCKFAPARSIQPTCDSFECKLTYATSHAEKNAAKRERAVKASEQMAAKEERKKTRAIKESLKTARDYMREAQAAFNAYIRERDKGERCICCGLPLGYSDVGGAYDCGHYRSVGSAPHLRFDERNAHAQRKQCNRWGAGRAVDYRIGLINRIGIAAVEELEADNTQRRYRADDYKRIRDEYRAKLKELKLATETREIAVESPCNNQWSMA